MPSKTPRQSRKSKAASRREKWQKRWRELYQTGIDSGDTPSRATRPARADRDFLVTQQPDLKSELLSAWSEFMEWHRAFSQQLRKKAAGKNEKEQI